MATGIYDGEDKGVDTEMKIGHSALWWMREKTMMPDSGRSRFGHMLAWVNLERNRIMWWIGDTEEMF